MVCLEGRTDDPGDAPAYERSEERTNSRNGYRRRPWDTRAGSVDLAVPKLREGSYFPDWLLTPRRRRNRPWWR